MSAITAARGTKRMPLPSSWEDVLKTAKKIKSAGKAGYVIRGQQGNPIVSDFLPVLLIDLYKEGDEIQAKVIKTDDGDSSDSSTSARRRFRNAPISKLSFKTLENHHN